MTQLAIGIATLVWRLVVAGAVIAARWMLGGFLPRGSSATDSHAARSARAAGRPVFPDHRSR